MTWVLFVFAVAYFGLVAFGLGCDVVRAVRPEVRGPDVEPLLSEEQPPVAAGEEGKGTTVTA